jgi:hypothetical protein
MATITLIQAAAHTANNIYAMTAQPMNVLISGLAGGAVQFTCTNPLATIKGATSVDITYTGNVGGAHQNIQVSSVIS